MTSIIKADNISTVSGSGNITIPTGVSVVGTDAGSIVAPGHVIQTVFSDYFAAVQASFNNSTFAPVTTAQATITPKFASSKILVQCNGSASSSAAANEWSWHLKRGSVWIGGNSKTSTASSATTGAHASGNSGGGSEAATTQSFNHLDSPNTISAITYILGFQGGESQTYSINRGHSTATNNYQFYHSGGCTITLMEIAQ